MGDDAPSKRLNVGCGRRRLDGYVNLDSVELPSVDVVCDVDTERLPFEDDTFEEILMSHVLEHLPHPLHAMQELWRVAKPDALCTVRLPYGSSDGAWEDPTHVRPYFHGSFGYFTQPYYWRADYGYRGDWQPEEITLHIPADRAPFHHGHAEVMRVVTRERNVVTEMVAQLRAIKPARAPERALQRPPRIRVLPG